MSKWDLFGGVPVFRVGPLWARLRDYPVGLANEYPVLRARVVLNRRDLGCWFEVVSDRGLYAAIPCVWPLPEWGSHREEGEYVASFIRRAVQAQEKRAARVSAEAGSWAAAHAAIWEYLTCDQFEDGEQREVSMLLVFVEDGRFKLALQDRQEGRSLWTVADSISEALRLLESVLKAGNGDWRQMRGAHQKKGKK